MHGVTEWLPFSATGDKQLYEGMAQKTTPAKERNRSHMKETDFLLEIYQSYPVFFYLKITKY